MKKITITFLFLFLTNILFAQSGWVSKFFHNTSGVNKIIKRDSLNYLGLSGTYYFKSTDSGNNWDCLKTYNFDTVSTNGGQFINSLTGWIVGSYPNYMGAILKTTNGGLNWLQQNSGFTNGICYSLCFLNENTGWIGTTFGTTASLLKTVDGGTSWTKQDFPGAYFIGSIKFFDNNNGWILGLNQLINSTTNGGQTWIPRANIPKSYYNYHGLNALSINECWFIAISHTNLIFSNFFKTTNGGNNWSLMYTYTDSLNTNASSFYGINFINPTIGFGYGGFNFIIKSSNSGLNWNRINTNLYLTLSDILPLSESEIFACGGGADFSYAPYEMILKTSNGGSNWTANSFNWTYHFSKIYFLDNNTGFVVGDSGRVFKTTNNGTNWNLILDNRNFWPYDISFCNSTTGCIIGSTAPYNYSRMIWRTTNTGDNWNQVFNTSTRILFSLKFINQLNGWIGCDSNKILNSTDGGLNWSLADLSNTRIHNIVSISFISNQTGWILGHYYYQPYPFTAYEWNTIWKTTNSGTNWNIIYDTTGSSNNLFIQFLNDNTGYKISYAYNRILSKTTNGGVNWYAIMPSGFAPYCLNFLNDNTGWVAGSNTQSNGRVLKTTNGGGNWIMQFDELNKTVQSIQAVDNNNAWFSGNYSSIYSTTNGGGIIGIQSINSSIPYHYSLSQNYPNPFNPTTKIKFDIPVSSLSFGEGLRVRLIIYDILGREVTTLVNESLKPGTYETEWDGSNFASGIYFYTLITDEFSETKRMVLIK